MPTTPKFILGIIAGEGSFSSSISIDHSRRLNVQPQLQFAVAMEDKKTLELIQETLDFGSVYHRSDGCTTWKCENKENRKKIINFIEQNASSGFKSTRKYEQFKKWRKANEYYDKYISHNPKSKEHMKKFVSLVLDVNEGVGYSGKTKADIIKEIDNGSLKQHYCGSEDTTSGNPCEQIVNSEDETCYNH